MDQILQDLYQSLTNNEEVKKKLDRGLRKYPSPILDKVAHLTYKRYLPVETIKEKLLEIKNKIPGIFIKYIGWVS